MTRTALFLALAVATTACERPDVLHMEMMSSMESETRGVVLYPDGQRGHAAMWGTTCEFDTLNGWLILDHDLPTDVEVIQDQYDDVVLGQSPEGLHRVQDRDRDVLLPGAMHGRLMADGSIGLLQREDDGRCVARFGEEEAPVQVPATACDPAIHVSTDRIDSLFAATGDELLRIGPDGTDTLMEGVDLAVWDETAGILYVAQVGDKLVTGLHADGSVAWETVVPGYVRSLDDMGKRGYALVMVEGDTGGELVVIEGISGEIITEHSTPTGDAEVTTSDDGRTVAITLPATVYFYDVTADGEPKKARRTLGSPDPIFTD